MSFWFSNPVDQETFFSLRGLTNKNNGFYRSLKQAQYLGKVYKAVEDAEQVKANFGVTVSPGQRVVKLTAHTRWADYGTRSIIPAIYLFVLDDLGVTDLYRIGGNGNLRDGWSPDTTKVKVVWGRPADAVCPFTMPTQDELDAAQASEPVSQWLGNPGDAVTVTATLTRFRDLGMGRFGAMCVSVFRDSDGNIFNVWKDLGLQDGDTVQITGKVKSTDEYNGVKQTTLTRVKVAEAATA